jgi:hypothetical protein
VVANAKRSCIAPNVKYKSFVKKTYCKHGVVVICHSDTRSSGSTAPFFFITAARLGFAALSIRAPKPDLSAKATKRQILKHFPILLCTTKLAQNFSQYYCVLESLHKALPSTTLYYKI